VEVSVLKEYTALMFWLEYGGVYSCEIFLLGYKAVWYLITQATV
jgi:hypothetical protein